MPYVLYMTSILYTNVIPRKYKLCSGVCEDAKSSSTCSSLKQLCLFLEKDGCFKKIAEKYCNCGPAQSKTSV